MRIYVKVSHEQNINLSAHCVGGIWVLSIQKFSEGKFWSCTFEGR